MLHICRTNNATYLIRTTQMVTIDNGQSRMFGYHPPEESDVRGEDDDSLRGGGCGLGGWAGVKDSG